MTAPGKWLDDHAISRNLARELQRRGVIKYEDGTFLWRYESAEGPYFRRRPLDGKVTYQPRGVPLGLWWPLGRAENAWVLLCEGESDTLAAASVLDTTSHRCLNGLCPVGLPGQGMNKERAAQELADAGTRHVTIAFDADEAGRRGAKKMAEALEAHDIPAYRAVLPAGYDLSDCLSRWVEGSARDHWLAREIALAVSLDTKVAA